jgi:hypothetical protein
MSVIQLSAFKQSKQKQYMKRYRSRLDHFVKCRVQSDSSGDILRLAEHQQMLHSSQPDIVWDYVEMREHMLDFVSDHIAEDIYQELKAQFWFDETYVTKEMVAERCLSYMILGPAAIAAE